MKPPYVIPFQIAIGPRTFSGAYPVHAAIQGAETTTDLELPATLLALAARLLQPDVKLPLGDGPALGQTLGRALFAAPLRDLLARSARGAARDSGRLQIQLQIAAPELAALPWEWMTVGSARQWSPALRDEYTLVHIGRHAHPAPPTTLAGPLRVLAAASHGEELQIEALHAVLLSTIHDGSIELHLLPNATPQALELALSADAPHVLHCAAPVGFTPAGVPQLLIGHGLAAFDLAALAAESPDLRLVTLAGPQGDAGTVCAATSLLATTLVDDELPAVIAFGGALPAPAAARFAATCYDRLAAGAPVDLAVTAGRRALARHTDGRGWGFPQLRLLAGAEQLFVFGRVRRTHSAGRNGVGRRARTEAAWHARPAPAAFPYWIFVAGAVVVLLALLLANRSFGARDNLISNLNRAALPTAVSNIRAQNLVIALPPTSLPATPPPQATPTTPPLPSATPSGYATIMTTADDTLERIAARMGSDAAALAALNHLDPQAPLRPDRPLVIPVFQPGEGGAGGLIIRRGDPATPKVALTFDIEIDEASLYGILDILRARGIKGTFFLTGYWVQSFPNAARAIVEQGHEIGNHSLTHPYFSRIGLDGAAAELEKTERIILETTGTTSRPYFRFPYGASTPATAAIVAQHGYIAYHWSADDSAITGWLDRAAQQPAEANGAILLMHGRPNTVTALPGWLDRLAAIGLQPTTLGEVLK